MTDIMLVFACLNQSLHPTALRQLTVVAQVLLAMTGRVTMLGLSRWAGKGGSYRTIQRFSVVSLNSRDGAHPNSRTGAPSPATDPGMLPRHGKTAIRWWSRHDRSYLLPLPGSQVATCVENRNLVWVQVPTRVLVTSCAEAPDGNRPVIPTTASQTT